MLRTICWAAVFAIPLPAVASTLYGSTVTAAGYYPTAQDRQTNFASALIGDDIEFPDGAMVYFEGGTAGASMDFRSSSLEIVAVSDGGPAHQYQFDGIIYVFDGAPAILGVTVNPISTVVPTDIAYTSNSISLNVAGVAPPPGSHTMLLDITLAPVPEPSQSLSLATALLVILARSIRESGLNRHYTE